MDKWLCRLLGVVPAKVLNDHGGSSVTCDPLVSGRGAADQFRLYLDQVEQELGRYRKVIRMLGSTCDNPEVRRARRTWADKIFDLDCGEPRKG